MKTTLLKLFVTLGAIAGLLFFQSCAEDEEPAIAGTVTTGTATDLTYFTATINGNVTEDGGASIKAKGIAYGTTAAPTIASDTTDQGPGIGAFEANLKDLLPGTTYYARAYAINKAGVSYGEEISFSTVDGKAQLTLTVPSVTYTKFKAQFNITSTGASAIQNSGVILATHGEPTIADAFWPSNSTALSIEKVWTGLEKERTYWVRAFATNSQGTSYSNIVQITMLFAPSSVTDINGWTYNVAVIGDRVWMTQNLLVTRYNNGDFIDTTPNLNTDITGSLTAYVWPTNADDNLSGQYGRLYNWYATQDSRKLCPSGYHMPTDADIQDLFSAVGTTNNIVKLKETGNTYWLTANGTNTSGFSARGAGMRDNSGGFNSFKENASFWTATQQDANNAGWLNMYDTNASISYPDYVPASWGLSVRCVKD